MPCEVCNDPDDDERWELGRGFRSILCHNCLNDLTFEMFKLPEYIRWNAAEGMVIWAEQNASEEVMNKWIREALEAGTDLWPAIKTLFTNYKESKR